MRDMNSFSLGEDFAGELDRDDPLASVRDCFVVPPDTIYMLGNSLGLISRQSRMAVERVLDEWSELGVGGWLEGDPPWFWMAERLGERAASLVGADGDEVICTGTTTFNIHSLVGTLYRPEGERTRILACSQDFSSDIYALKSQIGLKGLDWGKHLVLVGGNDNRLTGYQELVDSMTGEVAMALLPSVFYRSGQLLDMAGLVEEAHERGIIIGFDCSHSVGVIPHRFDEWGVDFAMWCSYKYLCGGPGAPGFLYLNRRHFHREPGLAGWFGNKKESQFDLKLDFQHAPGAGGWQVSSPGVLGAAGVEGALKVILDAGIERIREKSLNMTSYLIFLAENILGEEPYNFEVITPRSIHERGGHVALARAGDAMVIKEALDRRGVVADFRPPDIIRLTPSPLYNTYWEVREVVRRIRKIMDNREYRDISPDRKIIS